MYAFHYLSIEDFAVSMLRMILDSVWILKCVLWCGFCKCAWITISQVRSCRPTICGLWDVFCIFCSRHADPLKARTLKMSSMICKTVPEARSQNKITFHTISLLCLNSRFIPSLCIQKSTCHFHWSRPSISYIRTSIS